MLRGIGEIGHCWKEGALHGRNKMPRAALVIPCTRQTKRHIPQRKTDMDCVENGTVPASKRAGGGEKTVHGRQGKPLVAVRKIGADGEENGAGLVSKTAKAAGENRPDSQSNLATYRREKWTWTAWKTAQCPPAKGQMAGEGNCVWQAGENRREQLERLGVDGEENCAGLVSKTAKAAGENRPDSQSNLATGHRTKRVWAARKMATLPSAKRKISCGYFIAGPGKYYQPRAEKTAASRHTKSGGNGHGRGQQKGAR